MRRSHLNYLLPAMLLIGGCAVEGQTFPAQPDVKLPPPDARVQAWVSAIARPTSPREHFDAIEKVMIARQDGSLSDDVWITQCLIYLSPMEGEEELGAIRLLAGVSHTYGLIQSMRVLTVLAPYLDSTDRKVERSSNDLIEAFLTVNVFESYVRSCLPADPSWKLVGMIYGNDPNAALTSLAKIYLDRAGQQRVERNRKELELRILTCELADGPKQTEAAQQVSAKLKEMAGSANWFERVYVLAVMKQASLALPSRVRYWPGEVEIQTQLWHDPHPLVRSLTPMAGFPQFKNPD